MGKTFCCDSHSNWRKKIWVQLRMIYLIIIWYIKPDKRGLGLEIGLGLDSRWLSNSNSFLWNLIFIICRHSPSFMRSKIWVRKPSMPTTPWPGLLMLSTNALWNTWSLKTMKIRGSSWKLHWRMLRSWGALASAAQIGEQFFFFK